MKRLLLLLIFLAPFAYGQNAATTLILMGNQGKLKALGASSVDTASFYANWKLLAGATSYKLDVASDLAFTSLILNNHDVDGLTTHIVNSGLVSSTTYYYRIRATSKNGKALTSNVVTVTTNPYVAPPGAEQIIVTTNQVISPDAKSLIVR